MRRPATARAATWSLRAISVACALAAFAAASVQIRAEPDPGQSGTLPATAAARALAVFDAHCAGCHQEGHTNGRSPDAFDNVLDLEAVAGDPRLVSPKRPDASRIYQRLIGGHAPLDNYGAPAGTAGPTPDEIEAVRDWIGGLPSNDEACGDDRPLVTAASLEVLIGRWIESVGVGVATDTRFISLAHLENDCVSSARLKEFRDATAVLLAGLARRREPLDLETLGDASAILAVRVSQLALLDGEWERLTGGAPQSLSGAVPADWLASRILAGPRDKAGNIDPAFDLRFDGVGQRAVAGLARSWDRDVDLARAAAERGMTPRDLKVRLAGVNEDEILTAQRLASRSLSRAEWDRLSLALDGNRGASPSTPKPAAAPGAIDTAPGEINTAPGAIEIILWADSPSYKPRDLVTLNVSVSMACHLTLINVDQDGKAIVLFPNELEQDNLVAPGVTVRVPGVDAGYQFRFDRSGEEEIAAVCQRNSRRPDGIVYDYEKQRFAVLGDWRTFLRTRPERMAHAQNKATPDTARRRRRNRPQPVPEPPAIDPTGPAIEGRAAITIAVDPGGLSGP